MSEMDAVIAEERENRLKALKLELKKANREVKRLQRENNILSVMNEQASSSGSSARKPGDSRFFITPCCCRIRRIFLSCWIRS